MLLGPPRWVLVPLGLSSSPRPTAGGLRLVVLPLKVPSLPGPGAAQRSGLLRSPAEGEGNEAFPPQPQRDLECPSSTRLEALVLSHDPEHNRTKTPGMEELGRGQAEWTGRAWGRLGSAPQSG